MRCRRSLKTRRETAVDSSALLAAATGGSGNASVTNVNANVMIYGRRSGGEKRIESRGRPRSGVGRSDVTWCLMKGVYLSKHIYKRYISLYIYGLGSVFRDGKIDARMFDGEEEEEDEGR